MCKSINQVIHKAPPSGIFLFFLLLPITVFAAGGEERGVEFNKWLVPSVGVVAGRRPTMMQGAGTMVYYDQPHNYVYVLSVGHLFEMGNYPGVRYRADQTQHKVARVIVFYQNEQKLPRPRGYNAEVLCYIAAKSNEDVYDVSLMRFNPDWANPRCVLIAPKGYEYTKNKFYHSVGCDHDSAAAHYSVQYAGVYKNWFMTYHTLREGRSGGGLFTDDCLLIGICSRTNDSWGMWTPLDQIREFLREEGYGFILDMNSK